jgi:hypothetical protein
MFGYKIIAKNKVSPFSDYVYRKQFFPRGKKSGEWLPKRRYIETCVHGWHFCRNKKLIKAYAKKFDMYGDKYNMYRVEVRGEVIHDEEKSVAAEMRIVEKIDFWFEGVS